ncbi:MAG TPA: LysM peptidoglycan-binding domain-containing protein [Galbitalea sp.]|nr:LysM peptidoglycan-binding domain-containing protein [Galbitalea sp.]
MSEFSDRDRPSTSPFTGLTPTRALLTELAGGRARHLVAREPVRTNKTMFATMPVLLVGTLAMSSLGLATNQISQHPDQRDKSNAADPTAHKPRLTVAVKSGTTESSPAIDAGVVQVASVVVPSTYTVRAGDTVSGIAGQYGLSTASVLALNGLGWKSLIFPRQVLKLTNAAAPAIVATPAPTATATAPTAPTAAPAASTSKGSYTIQRGDTVTAIARKFGVSISAILAANGLVASSIIYAGRTLVIPGVGAQPAQVGTVTVVPSSSSSASAQANARTIISVGHSLGVPDYGIVIALAAAEQESGLQNLGYGDSDSVGLFQQRPSTGWGTVAQLTTPSYAAALFYGGPHNPNKGRTRGLLDIAGWQSMTVTQAAQAVQISATPNAYAKWESTARALLAQLG